METELFTLAYFSRNTLGQSDDMLAEIERILHAARRNNAARSITGALLYSDGCFGQVLEGPLAAVEAIFETIERDHRHRDVKVLHFKPLAERSFGNWSMAYAGTADPAALPLNIRDVLESPDKIEGAEAGQTLVAVLNDLIDKHDLHRA